VDDALRRRLDAALALLGLCAAMLVALAAQANPAALVGGVLLFLAGLAVWFVTAPLGG
jgi:uncharacterized membrane protein